MAATREAGVISSRFKNSLKVASVSANGRCPNPSSAWFRIVSSRISRTARVRASNAAASRTPPSASAASVRNAADFLSSNNEDARVPVAPVSPSAAKPRMAPRAVVSSEPLASVSNNGRASGDGHSPRASATAAFNWTGPSRSTHSSACIASSDPLRARTRAAARRDVSDSLGSSNWAMSCDCERPFVGGPAAFGTRLLRSPFPKGAGAVALPASGCG